MSASSAARPLPVVILVSGRGSNMEAILEACAGGLAVEVRAVISNRADAPALAVAARYGVPTQVLSREQWPQRDAYDQALARAIDQFSPAYVVLAGFMRILTTAFVEHYAGRLINIHPSLLPAFPGLQTHQRALDAGAREHGASVHFVVAEVDAGPVIAQARVAVQVNETAQQLAQRVLAREHSLYPAVLALLQAGRVTWNGGKILFDQQPLTAPLQF